MRGSFWQKHSLITHIRFELQPIIIFSPVANFGDQSLLHQIISFKGFFCFQLFSVSNITFLTLVSSFYRGECENLTEADKKGH